MQNVSTNARSILRNITIDHVQIMKWMKLNKKMKVMIENQKKITNETKNQFWFEKKPIKNEKSVTFV